jgi:hypothetical protein
MENPHNHQPFEGFCEVALKESSHFIETDEEPNSFTLWFYRRESEESSLDDFLTDLQLNNFGWDEPSQQLFFKSKDNQLYSVNFTKL